MGGLIGWGRKDGEDTERWKVSRRRGSFANSSSWMERWASRRRSLVGGSWVEGPPFSVQGYVMSLFFGKCTKRIQTEKKKTSLFWFARNRRTWDMILIFNYIVLSYWIYICIFVCRLFAGQYLASHPPSHGTRGETLVSSQRLPTRDSFQGGLALVAAACWFLGSNPRVKLGKVTTYVMTWLKTNTLASSSRWRYM